MPAPTSRQDSGTGELQKPCTREKSSEVEETGRWGSLELEDFAFFWIMRSYIKGLYFEFIDVNFRKGRERIEGL